MAISDTSVFTIDCHYLRPRFAAAFLVVEQGRAAFIDNNTSLALPYLLEALKAQNLKPEAVDYLIVTHAHLDHAGGTSALLNICKNAQVLAHPKAARTLIHPERLIQSAKKVYGEDKFHALYGEISPIPESRVRAVQNGETIAFGERTLSFVYTLGHASHHVCVHDSKSQGVFTGDSFGLCYPEIQNQGLLILPSTSPIDYDPVQAKKSVDQICSLKPKRLFLTHFGEVAEVSKAKDVLLENLDVHEKLFFWAKDHLDLGPELSQQIEKKLKSLYFDYADFLKLDLELNAQGIAFAASKLT
jgi:glyoxylase-like metal-dependent hydrolase (beta-lactamase superfamily II)